MVDVHICYDWYKTTTKTKLFSLQKPNPVLSEGHVGHLLRRNYGHYCDLPEKETRSSKHQKGKKKIQEKITRGGTLWRKFRHAFLFTPQISLCIILETWNFLCLLLLTLSSGKKSQIWNSRSYDLLYLGSKSRSEKFKLWHFLTDFRVWWLKMTEIEYRVILY